MQQESNEESWLEEQCQQTISGQYEESDREYIRCRDSSLSTVWGAFQDSATSVAHLYRERSSNTYPDTGALWLPFQTAAGTVTTLYKESCDGLKRTSEAASQYGYHKRTRELADWARSKKRRFIRREDLLAYLAGKPLPPLSATHTNRRSPKPEHTHHHSSHLHHQSHHHAGAASMFATAPAAATHMPTHGAATMMGMSSSTASSDPAHDLHTFKEALVLRPRGPELFAFVANEIARHCKRPASPIDDKMDICHYSSKRQRFM